MISVCTFVHFADTLEKDSVLFSLSFCPISSYLACLNQQLVTLKLYRCFSSNSCATVRMLPSICLTLLFRINTCWGDTKEIKSTPQQSHHWSLILSDYSTFYWVKIDKSFCWILSWVEKEDSLSLKKQKNFQISANQNTDGFRHVFI